MHDIRDYGRAVMLFSCFQTNGLPTNHIVASYAWVVDIKATHNRTIVRTTCSCVQSNIFTCFKCDYGQPIQYTHFAEQEFTSQEFIQSPLRPNSLDVLWDYDGSTSVEKFQGLRGSGTLILNDALLR